MDRTREVQGRLEEAKHSLELAQRASDYEKASELLYSIIPNLEDELEL